MNIKSLKAREILDSRGDSTIEVDLITDQGLFRASVPSGASVGKYEAKELRDKGKRYQGKGVLKARNNINKIIAPKIKGRLVQQKEIDDFLIKLDGTKNKSKLGANAILGVSMAVCRAEAAAKKIPLYKHIKNLSGIGYPLILPRSSLPRPCFNIINGGVHAGNDLDIQEFMIIPHFSSFSKSYQAGSEIYHILKKILKKKFGSFAVNLGDEGGFAPNLSSTKSALDLILRAINVAGYKNKVKIGLDIAASELFSEKGYRMDGKILKREKLLDYYSNLIKKYPIAFFEDAFEQDDWKGWKKISDAKITNLLIVGDDLLCTNPERIKKAHKEKLCNGMILKINQIGTISEAIEAVKLAKSFNWKIIVSHRSAETCDDFIADLANGISADYIKAGAPARGERVAKYNRLLRIEEELK